MKLVHWSLVDGLLHFVGTARPGSSSLNQMLQPTHQQPTPISQNNAVHKPQTISVGSSAHYDDNTVCRLHNTYGRVYTTIKQASYWHEFCSRNSPQWAYGVPSRAIFVARSLSRQKVTHSLHHVVPCHAVCHA